MDIEKLYEKRLQVLHENLLLGADFDSALEMLPAVPAPCAETAGAPCEEVGDGLSARALTGRLLCTVFSPEVAASPYCGGFDGGTVVNYFGRWSDQTFFECFNDWKESAKDAEENNEEYFQEVDFYKFQVAPYGAPGGVNFKYVFKWNSFRILIASKADPGERPAVQVDFSYESFREKDLFESRLEVEDFLLYLGFRWDRVSFQRVDINVTVDAPFKAVSDAFNDGRFLSRLRIFRPVLENTSEGMSCNYIAGGSVKTSDVSICLYDKLHELSKKYDEQKIEDIDAVMANAENLTRCEFRLTSAFFRTLDCRSFERLEELLPSIVDYLTCAWFRILKDRKVRGHENTQELDLVWQKIQYAFFQVFVKKEVTTPLERKKAHKRSNLKLFRQAVGCVTTAMARTRERVASIDDFCADVFDYFLSYKRLCYHHYLKKRRRIETELHKVCLQ